MNYPKYVEVENKRYKINTDFRYAIECNKISQDNKIGDYERALAIIYTLFGEDALNTPDHHKRLLELAKIYLSCGEDLQEDEDKEPDMDYIKDMPFIEASFMSDYHIDLENTQMHWWKFFRLINGLSNSELGNCCILNAVRNIRNADLSEIKDAKTKENMRKAKKFFALNKKPKKEATSKELKSAEEFYSRLKI